MKASLLFGSAILAGLSSSSMASAPLPSPASRSPRSARRLAQIRQSIRQATPSRSTDQRQRQQDTMDHARQLLEKTVLWDQQQQQDVDASASSPYVSFHGAVASAATSTRTRGRRLQQDCPFEAVFVGNCTLQDYCTQLDQSEPEAEVACDGEAATLWNLVSTSNEQCLYFGNGEEEPQPYDAAAFNPLTDVCFHIVVTITFDNFTPTAYTRVLEFTRPNKEEFSETSSLTECSASANGADQNQLIPGFCGTCNSAQVGTTPCNSCKPCPAGSSGNKLLDCSNLAPTFVTDCGTEDDDVFLPFGEYTGAVCTFDAVASGACPLEKFCNVYEAVESPETIDCSGSVDSEWFVKLAYDEECYYHDVNNSNGAEPEPKPFDPTRFDAAAGHYCSKVTVQINFKGTKSLTEEYTEWFTKPRRSTGKLSVIRDLVECDWEDSDYEFATPVCANDCGDLTIGQSECTSGCQQCPSGGQVLTCTNVDKTLFQSCDEEDDQVTAALLKYFRDENRVAGGDGSSSGGGDGSSPGIGGGPSSGSGDVSLGDGSSGDGSGSTASSSWSCLAMAVIAIVGALLL